MTDTAIEVTQADRDAAANYLEINGGANMELTIQAVRRGDADKHAAVQAFARFEAQTLERAAQTISAWAFAHDINGAVRNDLLKRIRTGESE